jgi:predicted RNA-binding protein YlxR (DUF448 family)
MSEQKLKPYPFYSVTKKRKYYRKCGICGERHEQSEMIRDNGSPNGWLCMDCHIDKHTDWYI